MTREILERKRFTIEDQERFARLSGDRNPLHMDPVAARRTQAGAPVVHGIHTLLWFLDVLSRKHPDLPPFGTVNVRFEKLLYVGETAEAIVTHCDASGVRAEVTAAGTLVVRVTGTFGKPKPPNPTVADTEMPVQRPLLPAELSLKEIAGRTGRVGFAGSPGEIARAFPDAARAWGERRVAAFACCTYLVGMVCPGLHSIFGGLVLTRCEEADERDAISFRVTLSDPRFRLVRMEISGGGLAGNLETFVRQPPVAQAGMAELAGRITPGEFAGTTALIVGGSRGLGELTAKILAAGGAQVLITYAAGQADTERVRDGMTTQGGNCEMLHYDVRAPAGAQLVNLAKEPAELYYFATPAIFRRKTGVFAQDKFNDFFLFYVTGFYDLCQMLCRRRSQGISAFYPSSTAVETRPAGMTEYAMVKAAGEILCTDMMAYETRIHITIKRLPRLPTDQTATLMQAEAADPVEVIVPIVREVHARSDARSKQRPVNAATSSASQSVVFGSCDASPEELPTRDRLDAGDPADDEIRCLAHDTRRDTLG
ncbi:MAG: SDR family NAD(P)-dependent oxidoreductase [Verrucomicrobia bacterium]|nr:SDR family NAD(P)-dependent oxidoreductase [Verrucomicrobiota bacterium]